MTDLNEILEKSGIINFSYQKLRQEDTFNIFTILKKRDDEVQLHSRFIFELLNPKGSHNKQKEFLNLYLDTLEISDFSVDDVLVRREFNDIDILITNKNKQAIIIENKIWAGDQSKQLERYYNDIVKLGFRDIKIFYLAPHEKEPSLQSAGKVPKDIIFTISYQFHINQWINKCAGVCAFNPNIRETLNQYQKLISDMTGNSYNRKEQEDYFQLMAVGDNAIKANRIVQNWIYVRKLTELSFWNDLENKISEVYKVLDIGKFNSKTLNSAINATRKRNVFYGLTFKFASHEDFDFGIRLRRNGFRTTNLVYVLVVIKEGKIRDIKESAKYLEIADRLKHLSDGVSDFNWLVDKATEINFENFTNNRTLELVNHESRNKSVTELWSAIQVFISDIEKAMKNDGNSINTEGV